MHRIVLRARANQHFAYSGQSLLVTNLDGQIAGRGTEGFYVENTRLLSCAELLAHGKRLTSVAASPVGGAGFFSYAEVPAGALVPEHAVFAETAHFVGDGLRTTVRLDNYDHRAEARFGLTLRLAADFADMEEAESGERKQTGKVEATWDEGRQEITFRYCHPQLDRAVTVRVEQAPGRVCVEDTTLLVPIELPPHGAAELHLSFTPIFDGVRRDAPPATFDDSATPLGRERQRLREQTTQLTATNASVARAWQTAVDDLASLPLGLAAGPTAPIAGLPIYQQFFGRDTLTIAWQALLAQPGMLADTLRANAAGQGTVTDDWRDEQPGKLIHQAGGGPLAVLGITPFARYYGDYATPPDFLIMLGQYLAWSDDRRTVRALLPAARRAVEWLDRYGDLDRDGFIEYVTRSAKGVKNQGWKDAEDAIVDEGGEIIDNPIAACELQGYWYAGLQQAATAFLVCGEIGYAIGLLGKARRLRQRFNKRFWNDDKGFYAMALGPDKRQVTSIASNAGHLLATGIVPHWEGRRVVQRLMQPDMFSGWGIRTLSSNHPMYNPFSYHRGSVWPVENGTFAFGFARYGCWEELHRLAEAVFAAAELFVANRLPEVLGGLARDSQHPHPGIYPRSNEPQGWSASMVPMVIQALLGLHPFAPARLLFVDPHLPDWLPELRLEGVRVGNARVDLDFHRSGDGATRYRVVRRVGSVRVLHQPPPDAPGAGPVARAGALLGSLFNS